MTKGFHAYTVTTLIRVIAKTAEEAMNVVRSELASQLNDKRTKTNGWCVMSASKSKGK